MTKADVQWSGVDELQDLLTKMTKLARDGMRAGLHEAASDIMDEAKERAPLDMGDLRGSGYVGHPKQEGTEISVPIGFGGPAAPYAVVQHEREDFNHDVGEAKYLEKAIDNQIGEAGAKVGAAVAEAIRSGGAQKSKRRHRRTQTTTKTRRRGK